MKKAIMGLLLVMGFATIAYAGWVNGYYKANGTYVQGYYRSDSNNNVKDNYSYKGNINPYTGKEGTNYYKKSLSSDYYEGTPTPTKTHNNYDSEYTPKPTKTKSYFDSEYTPKPIKTNNLWDFEEKSKPTKIKNWWDSTE